MARLRYVSMFYYVLRKDGAFAGVTMWSQNRGKPRRYAVHDGSKRAEIAPGLFQGEALDWPPIPRLPQERK